jgi:hypothetical protein
MVQDLQASQSPSSWSLTRAVLMAPIKAKMRSDFGEAQLNRADGPTTDLRITCHTPGCRADLIQLAVEMDWRHPRFSSEIAA